MRARLAEFPLYFVDSAGFVCSQRGAALKSWTLNSGYQGVSLRRDGKTYRRLVHRLVLTAFRGPCPDGQESRHGDGDRSHNALSNLQWGTRSDNALDRYAHGYSMSAEARAAVSIKHRGKKLSAEHRAKLSIAKMGNQNRRIHATTK